METQTLERRTVMVDRDLARRADRKMRKYGFSLDDAVQWAFMLIVDQRGIPDFATPLRLEFYNGSTFMRKRRGVSVAVESETTPDGMFTAQAESIGLDAFASTKAELASEVSKQLEMLWKEYALADDSELTESARKVKRNLLATFEEA